MPHILNTYLDKTLRYISGDATKFYPISKILEKEEIPADKDTLRSIVESLEKNNHIEVKCMRYEMPQIRIKAEGLAFISKTSYEKNENNQTLKKSYFLSGSTKENSATPIVIIQKVESAAGRYGTRELYLLV
jgi:hypothetical protein